MFAQQTQAPKFCYNMCVVIEEIFTLFDFVFLSTDWNIGILGKFGSEKQLKVGDIS